MAARAQLEVRIHGTFTYALLEGLSGAADLAPKDGKVTVLEIKAYLDEQVPRLTAPVHRDRAVPQDLRPRPGLSPAAALEPARGRCRDQPTLEGQGLYAHFRQRRVRPGPRCRVPARP